jgi:hypothetical protein
MAEGLQIRIAADVEAALRSLANIQRELEKTKLAGDNAAKGADAAARGFSKLPQSANQATLAMSNLGRVVQDAPFGFIAIANNLDPLLQSFQQLQKTSGGTTGALKSLLGSLTGPGGIALALSAVTSAITFAQIGFDRWFGGLSKNKGVVDEQAKEFARLQEVIRSLGGSVNNLSTEFGASANAQISKINALIAVVNNLNATDEERQNALRQLQQLNKAYFGDVTLSAKGLELLKSRQDEYNKALQNQSAQQGFVNKLNDAEVESAKVENKVAALQKQLINLRAELARTPRFEIKGQTEVETKRYRDLQSQITNVNNELKGQQSALDQLNDARGRLQQGLSQTVTAGVGFKPLVEDKTNITNTIQDVIAEAKRIAAATDESIDIRLNLNPLDTEAEQFQKAKAFLDKWKSGAFKFTLQQPQEVEYPVDIKLVFGKPSDKSDSLLDIAGQINQFIEDTKSALAPALKNITPFTAIIEEQRRKYFDTSGVVIDLSLPQTKVDVKNFKKGVDAANKEIDEISEGFKQNIANALQTGLEGIGESLGELVSGQDFGKSILNVMSTLLSAIGKALIAYGIAKEGIDKILGPAGIAIPGSTAILLGIGAIAASSLLKNFGGARAEGGPVSGNKTYLVGERGPELFVPNVAGTIVPNDQIPSFGQGLASMLTGGGRGGTTLRGQDIILAYARTQRSQLRVNG